MSETVATPLLSVTETPANAPSRVKDTGTPEMTWPLAVVRVAVSVAGPARGAVPDTLVKLDAGRVICQVGRKALSRKTRRG